jgi:RimJ/RimL family protein N-acetyltransferase
VTKESISVGQFWRREGRASGDAGDGGMENGPVMPVQFALRPVEVGDLDAIFEQMRDPESVRMAAFTPGDPSDRGAFAAHMAEVMSSSEAKLWAIMRDSQLVGTIGCWVSDGATEVTYWIDRGCWGQGIATRALSLLLEAISARPIRARAASDNAGSLRVLRKAGFHPIGAEVSYAPGRAAETEETILELP